jgi:DNA modification methylase
VGQILNDDRADWREVYELWRPEVLYVWHGGLHADVVKASMQEAGYLIRSQIIWAKPSLVISRGHYHWQHEPCWYGVRKGFTANWQGDRTMTTLWSVGNGSATSRSEDEKDQFHAGHISQKPVELFRKPILNHTGFGEVVAEPFAGSGTAFVAAEQLGRLCYGMDLDPQAVAMTLERLSLMGLPPQLV